MFIDESVLQELFAIWKRDYSDRKSDGNVDSAIMVDSTATVQEPMHTLYAGLWGDLLALLALKDWNFMQGFFTDEITRISDPWSLIDFLVTGYIYGKTNKASRDEGEYIK